MGAEDLLAQTQWDAAQAIRFGVDLVSAAKQQLALLAAVDRYPCLYEGPAVKRAVQRYEQCWLPLIATFGNFTASGLAFVPPLDCAWIWHCHRLNPVQYLKDCKARYGRFLDAPLVELHSAEEAIKLTIKAWNTQYPNEEYSLDLNQFLYTVVGRPVGTPDCEFSLQDLKITDGSNKITYDLEAAVARQRSFFYQVSGAHMWQESFLQAAEQRYKGFLHLFRITKSSLFFVPTYDIDLMWHAHQLSPLAYRKDTLELLGHVLNHDDTDSDRSEGQKIHTGFNDTRAYWERTFGTLYERAGAMYRGEPPSPVPPPEPTTDVKDVVLGTPVIENDQESYLTQRRTMQVSLTVIGARNVPTKDEGSLFVRLQFQQKCSKFRKDTVGVPTTSDPEWKQFWAFESEEATEGMHFELRIRHSNSFKGLAGSKEIGRVDLSWRTLLESPTLSLDKWLNLSTQSHYSISPALRICVSITPSVTAPYLFRTVYSLPTDEKGQMMMGGMLPQSGKWLTVTVLDHSNKEVFVVRSGEKLIHVHQGGRENQARIIGIAQQQIGNEATLSVMRQWSLLGNAGHLTVSRTNQDQMWTHGPTLELTGNLGYPVRLLCGRKLQYEVKAAMENEEAGFVTVVRYTADVPSGKATALFNWRSGTMEVLPEENAALIVLLSSIVAMSVVDMQGLEYTTHAFKKNMISISDEWGSVTFNHHRSSALNDGMFPFYSWWYTSPSDNALFGKTGYVAAGGCGGGCGGCGGGGCVAFVSGCERSDCGTGGGCGGGCGGGGCVAFASGCERSDGGTGGGCGGGCGGGGCVASAAGGCGGCGGGCGSCGGGGGCGGCGGGGGCFGIRLGGGCAEGGGCGGCGGGGLGSE